MTVFQLMAAVIVCLISGLLLKSFNERFAVYISLAGIVIVLGFVLIKLSSVFAFIYQLAEDAGIKSDYFQVVIKGLAVCYLGEFTTSACKSGGQNGLGDAVELACRCTLLVLAIPLFEDFLAIIVGMLE